MQTSNLPKSITTRPPRQRIFTLTLVYAPPIAEKDIFEKFSEINENLISRKLYLYRLSSFHGKTDKGL